MPRGTTGEPLRGAVVATTAAELADALARRRPTDPRPRELEADPPPLAFLLPGQGAQYDAMGTGLYGLDSEFTRTIDAVFAALGDRGSGIRARWLAGVPLEDTELTQPLLFGVDLGVARALMKAGAVPQAVLGHSIGELAGAVLAGVFSLDGACALLADRLSRLPSTPSGGMLAVAGAAEDLAPLLPSGAVVGVVNGPRQCLVCGPDAALAETEARLADRQITFKRVRARHAFHSPAVEAVSLESEPVVAATARSAPDLTVYSSCTGQRLTAAQSREPRYWALHPAAPVVFGAALDTLAADGPFTVVETGPGRGLYSLAARHRGVAAKGGHAVPTLPARRPARPDAESRALCAALAELWVLGYEIKQPGSD